MRRMLVLVALVVAAGVGSIAGCSTTPTTPTTRATPTNCSLASMSVSLVFLEAAAGQVFHALVFQNVGSVACRLQGYPTIAVVVNGTRTTATTSQLGPAGDVSPALLTIAPGGFASAAVDSVEMTSDRCWTVHSLTVMLPGSSEKKTLAASLSSCSTVGVQALVYGKIGRIRL